MSRRKRRSYAPGVHRRQDSSRMRTARVNNKEVADTGIIAKEKYEL